MPKMVVEVADRCTARRDGRPNNSGEADGEVRGDVPAKPRSSRGGGRCGDAEGGDGDVGRRSGEAAGMAGDGGVVATPLVVGEDASLVISPRNGGEAGEEAAAATPGEVTAQPDGARARRERRLEAAGAKEREGRRRERSSGG